MRIVLPREEFLDAVGWTASILPVKPYTPVLGGVYIVADDDGYTKFCAYDTEVSAEQEVKAEVQAPGQVLVSGRLLAAISKVLPKQPVELYTTTGTTEATLKCGKAEFTLPTMAVGTYPPLPKMPPTIGGLDAADLAEAVGQVLPATSADQAMPHLCAVLIQVAQDKLTLWATDKHRVATRVIPWDAKATKLPQRLLVPSRAMHELGRLADADSVFLAHDADAGGSGTLGIYAGTRMTTTRLVDNPFPNCSAIMPTYHDTVASVGTEDLRGALQRALLLDNSEFPRVHLSFFGDGLALHAASEGTGVIQDEIALAKMEGNAKTLWVNTRFLQDAITSCRSDNVLIGMQNEHKPLLVAPDTIPWPEKQTFAPWAYDALGGDYRHLVMPVAGSAE